MNLDREEKILKTLLIITIATGIGAIIAYTIVFLK